VVLIRTYIKLVVSLRAGQMMSRSQLRITWRKRLSSKPLWASFPPQTLSAQCGQGKVEK